MIRKRYAVFAAGIAFALILTSCSKQTVSVSSLSVSSKIAEKETVSSYPYDESDWGIPISDNKISRPLFISFDRDNNIFYCSANGTVFKQLAGNDGFSKIFSSKDYTALSANYISENMLCVGYKSAQDKYGYALLDLKEKTIKSAIDDKEFEGRDILSLNYIGENAFFLSTPDRYNRYSLYRKTAQGTFEIAKGVNEYFVLRNKVFYNVGSYIFSINPDGTNRKLICDVPTQDLIGFCVVSDYIIYSTTDCSYIMQMYSNSSSSLDAPLKVWTSAAYGDDYIFFCGQKGGIYSFSVKTATVNKVSEYCALDIAVKDGTLYMSPAQLSDYPEAEEMFVITDFVKTFNIEALLKSGSEEKSVSSSLSSIETQSETPPLSPEKFGK